MERTIKELIVNGASKEEILEIASKMFDNAVEKKEKFSSLAIKGKRIESRMKEVEKTFEYALREKEKLEAELIELNKEMINLDGEECECGGKCGDKCECKEEVPEKPVTTKARFVMVGPMGAVDLNSLLDNL